MKPLISALLLCPLAASAIEIGDGAAAANAHTSAPIAVAPTPISAIGNGVTAIPTIPLSAAAAQQSLAPIEGIPGANALPAQAPAVEGAAVAASAAKADDPDRPSAMSQLREELKQLQKQEDQAKLELGVSDQRAAEFKRTGGAAEAAGRAHSDLITIRAKRDGLVAAAQAADRARYDELRAQVSKLEVDRNVQVAIANHEAFNGDRISSVRYSAAQKEEAAKRADALKEPIARLKSQIRVLERDNPSFAPIVSRVRRVFGIVPMTPAEKRLAQVISDLRRDKRKLEVGLTRIYVGQKDAPSLAAIKAAEGMRILADSLGVQITAKQRELDQMTGR
jgi:hypothetical protein